MEKSCSASAEKVGVLIFKYSSKSAGLVNAEASSVCQEGKVGVIFVLDIAYISNALMFYRKSLTIFCRNTLMQV